MMNSILQNKSPLWDAAFLAALFAVTAVVLAVGIGKSELFVNNDETRHAMTGVFVADAIYDFPVNDPAGYAKDYYEQYPALGLVHWPPLFYAAEGAGYIVGGVSVTTARIVVIVFALTFVLFLYKLVALCLSRWIAFAATLAAILTPQVVYYGRAVMLEIPALAMCTAASYYFYRAISDRTKRSALICGIVLAGALLTKQHAFFLIPFFALYTILSGRFREFFRARWIAPAAIVIVLAGGYYTCALMAHGATLLKDVAGGGIAASDWLWYLRTLPKQIGSRLEPNNWNAIAVSAAVLATFAANLVWCIIALRRKGESAQKREARFLLFCICWIICCFLFFSAFSQKDSRHIIFWIPALAVSAMMAFRRLGLLVAKMSKSSVCGFCLAAFLAGLFVLNGAVEAMNSPREFVSGYEEAAQMVLDEQAEGTVFFAGYLNANFIFFVRKHDPARSVGVSRASKDIFDTEIMAKYGVEMKARTERDVIALLCKKGVRHIVVEDRNLFDSAEEGEGYALVRSAITRAEQSGRARFLREVPVSSNVPRYSGLRLRIYRFDPTGDFAKE